MINLTTSDNENFSVERDVAIRSVLIKNMIEDVGESENAIPLPNVSSNVLKKVIEWCEHHKKDPEPVPEDSDDTRKKTTEISDWDQKFIQVDQEMLFEIILAANYLDIKPLLDVGCKTVANMIKGKQPEEIRKLFNIVNDFTPEEEAQIKKETYRVRASSWYFSSLNNFMTYPRKNVIYYHTSPENLTNCKQPPEIRPLDSQLCRFGASSSSHPSSSKRVPIKMVSSDRPVPSCIPGELITNPEQIDQLRHHLSELCHLSFPRFPGSQPVSFDRESLGLLEQENFWVCEKSDGVRVIVFIVATETGQETYLIDRKEDFYQNYGLIFPHQDGPEFNHSNTVLDGEMVIDVDPITGKHMLRLLAFDLLVCDTINLMSKPLSSRYGRLKDWVISPYKRLLLERPEMAETQPFEVLLKPQELAYGILAVFKEHLPRLLHGNDGLIFTSAEAPYTPGTDQKILKWKPPSENSIDFLLQLKFPPLPDQPKEVDLTAKPRFMLMMNHGHEGTHYFDTIEVEDSTWEDWKRSGEQYDDRVVEVVWDKERDTWKLLRFRDDKREGNYKTVVTSIIKSIQHGVEAETLIEHATNIKARWRAREAAQRARQESGRNGGGNGSSSQPRPPVENSGFKR